MFNVKKDRCLSAVYSSMNLKVLNGNKPRSVFSQNLCFFKLHCSDFTVILSYQYGTIATNTVISLPPFFLFVIKFCLQLPQ